MDWAMRDFPIPGSPDTSTTQLPPTFACSEAARQQVDFLFAPDQSREAPRIGSRRRSRQAPAIRNVLDETLERNGSEIAMVEQAAGQPACPRRNHYRARLGQRLEPSGQVGGLANDRLFPGRSGTDEVADRDKSGGDAGGGGARLLSLPRTSSGVAWVRGWALMRDDRRSEASAVLHGFAVQVRDTT
jgi:hypothetical protein